MRICVFSINGNVAKSTFANYVALPRLGKDAEAIYVEGNNTVRGKREGATEYSATPEDFAELMEYLSTNVVGHNIVVDFGSTDSRVVRNLFGQCYGSQDEFDLFVVPHSPDAKQEDTALTIDFLEGLGVPAEKIRLVFTIIPLGKTEKDLEKMFRDLFEHCKERKNCVIDTRAVIYATPLFERIARTECTIESIYADKTDWQQKIIDAHPDRETKKDEIAFYSWNKHNRGLVIPLMQNFDKVFAIIIGANDKSSKPAKKAVNHA